jgi:putative ABC transport system permease protein
MVTDAGLWLAPGSTVARVEAALAGALPRAERIETAQPGEIRQLSLSIFDRTFAVTYVLEGCAIVIGLFGLATSISGQVLARRREFGMLRHVGMIRRQIGTMLAVEGLLSSALGLAVGFIPGWLISLILVHVVNRQSFHWSMDLHMPWGQLVLLALVMLVLATLTSALSGRHGMGSDVVRAVREDW